MGVPKGLNDTEVLKLALATSANGEREADDANPKPKLEVREADGNCSADGGC